MITYSRSINNDLLSFWYEQAKPGRIGLLDIDVIVARLIGWAERRITPDHEPSPWAHVFFFVRPLHGVPWIAESDFNVPLPGFRPKQTGPQKNLIYKWAHPAVTQAAVLDSGLSEEQYLKLEEVISGLVSGNYTYRVSELAEAALALMKHDLSYRAPFHHDDTMHCAHFVRECLKLIGCDPLGSAILSENTVPEHFAQSFPILASWTRDQIIKT